MAFIFVSMKLRFLAHYRCYLSSTSCRCVYCAFHVVMWPCAQYDHNRDPLIKTLTDSWSRTPQGTLKLPIIVFKLKGLYASFLHCPACFPCWEWVVVTVTCQELWPSLPLQDMRLDYAFWAMLPLHSLMLG